MEQQYGPKTETVEAFLHHLLGMTPEQWELARLLRSLNDDLEYWEAAWVAAGKASRGTAREAAWKAVWEAAGEAVGRAAWGTAMEIMGADFMREWGQPFRFLPLFGFANPEEITNVR